jgi:dimethylglycine dehydrogenase
MVEKGGNLVASDESFEIHAEHVVTATGNHAQRTARLLGIKTPAIPVEHQYIVTEPDPMLRNGARTTPNTRSCATPTPNGMSARNAAAGSLAPTNGRPARFEYNVPKFPRRPVPSRPRTDRTGIHVDDPPDSFIGNGWPEGRFQRPDLLYP